MGMAPQAELFGGWGFGGWGWMRVWYRSTPQSPTPQTPNPQIILPVHGTGGIIWEVEGRGSGSKRVAYHTDSPTWVGESV